jgi:hypothetical protein
MASRNLGALTVDLVLKMGGFKQGMDKASRETDRFQKRLQSQFAGMGKVLGAFGLGFSVVGIVRGLTTAGAAAIEFGDEMQKASAKTGIAVEDLSELAYAAKQNDIEISGLNTALKKMQVTLSEAGSGSKSANETLAALGLTFKELQTLAPDKQFELLADRIAGLRDPADRTRAAVELFGRAGADLLPLFEQGAAGIRAMREEANRMGATLTGEQAKALAEADDAIKRLGQAWDGLTRTATGFIALPLAGFLNRVTDALAGQEPPLTRVAGLWKDYFAVISAGPTGIATRLLKEFTSAAKEAASVEPIESPLLGTGLPPGGRNRKPFVPGFLGDDGEDKKIKKVASETDKAAERVKEFILTLQDQAATFGLTEAASLRYSITTGDLARDLDKLGAKAGPLREKLLSLAGSLDDQQATASINEQITALNEQAATLALTEEQAFAYSVTQGELAETLARTGEDADELTRSLLEASNRVAGIRAELEREQERKSIFEATRTDAEQYAETLEHLQDVFRNSEDQETYGRAVADAAGEMVEASTAAEEYRLVLEELNKQLAEGGLTQEAYDGAVARAKETFEEAGREAAKVFTEEAKRNTQDILADFLTDPFAKGLDGLVEDFGKTFQRIAAQAVAAKLADKLFDGMDEWIGKLGELFSGGGFAKIGASIAGFFGFADGGYTGAGSKYQPAGVVHAGEFVARSEVVRQPGAVPFLEAFNRHGMSLLAGLPGFADGGMVGRNPYGATAMRAVATGGGAVTVHQNFTIQAPAGSVSRATQQQIGAKAAQGLASANRRNN